MQHEYKSEKSVIITNFTFNFNRNNLTIFNGDDYNDDDDDDDDDDDVSYLVGKLIFYTWKLRTYRIIKCKCV